MTTNFEYTKYPQLILSMPKYIISGYPQFAGNKLLPPYYWDKRHQDLGLACGIRILLRWESQEPVCRWSCNIHDGSINGGAASNCKNFTAETQLKKTDNSQAAPRNVRTKMETSVEILKSLKCRLSERNKQQIWMERNKTVCILGTYVYRDLR